MGLDEHVVNVVSGFVGGGVYVALAGLWWRTQRRIDRSVPPVADLLDARGTERPDLSDVA